LIRVRTPRRNFGERQLGKPIGIVFSQAKLIDDEERHLAPHVVGAVEGARKTIEHLVEGRRHQPD
jgi:hypothetical protein